MKSGNTFWISSSIVANRALLIDSFLFIFISNYDIERKRFGSVLWRPVGLNSGEVGTLDCETGPVKTAEIIEIM
jgi:hypothetical protein